MTSPAPQPADGEREVDPWATEPADWTREQAEAAQAELDALELTDPAVRAAAESYDRMVKRVTRRKPTTPASAEPTEVDWDNAQGCIERACQGNDWSEVIARALASQRAEIVARYEKVADRLDGQARILRKMALTAEDDEGAELAHAAAAIREAAPK